MPNALEALNVMDPEGASVRLGSLWADRTAVLVFVRHFGCLFCRQQIAELAPYGDRIRSLGAELVVIGHGTLEETRAFRDEHQLPFALFTDPGREAYCALGMQRGRRAILSPRVAARAATALWRGFRQTHIAGDPLQQGGVVVVRRGGEEIYRFISRDAGDHPPAPDILKALESAG